MKKNNLEKKTEKKQEVKRIPTTRYTPNPEQGLTSQQVQEHRLHGWTNRAVDPPSKTTRDIIHDFGNIVVPCWFISKSDIFTGYYC